MELNGAVGIVAAKVKVEFPGLAKSAWNLYRFKASKGAPYGPLLSCDPTKKLGLPAGGGVEPSMSLGSNPSPTERAWALGGTRNEITCGLGSPASA